MPEPLPEPRRVYGHYEVESVLGRGAMGLVYLARDQRIGRRVALKTVHVEEKFDDDSEAREFYKRLQREAELCGALQHPNIVTLYEPGYDNGIIAWMATEYVDGESLRERLRKRKPLPIREALTIGEDILRGLEFAHSKGIVHRDVKPANILLTLSGQAKIADFGIARPVDSNLTAVGEMLGTPSYMSPEQVKCTAVTSRSDVFSAGAVIYEMVTGVKAFGASDVQSILRNVVELTPRRANEIDDQLPQKLVALLQRMMAKAPEDRIASAAAAADEVREIRKSLPPEEIEELSEKDEAGVSTLAAASPRTSTPTPAAPVEPRPQSLASPGLRVTRHPVLRRKIPAALFFAVIGLLAAGVAALSYSILHQTDPRPTVTLTVEQQLSHEQKRRALAGARVMLMAGEYEQSIKGYDNFLARYPNTPSAIQGRAEAVQALEAARAQTKVTVVAKKPPRKRDAPVVAPPEPEKKKGFWRRVFGRD